MKLIIDQQVLNFDGTTILNEIEPAMRLPNGTVIPAKREPLTFRAVIESSLLMDDPNTPLTIAQKVNAYRIGTQINSGGTKQGEYDLNVTQLAFLKDRIGKFFNAVVYGRFLELIKDNSILPEGTSNE